MKCSRKQARNLDSARPPSPVALVVENEIRSGEANDAPEAETLPPLIFLFEDTDPPGCCCAPAAVAPRGRPSFLLVLYVHCTPARRQRSQGISPVHLHFFFQHPSQELRSRDKAKVNSSSSPVAAGAGSPLSCTKVGTRSGDRPCVRPNRPSPAAMIDDGEVALPLFPCSLLAFEVVVVWLDPREVEVSRVLPVITKTIKECAAATTIILV